MRYLLLCILAACIGCRGCITVENPYAAIPSGIWRAELDLAGGSAVAEPVRAFDERTDGKLPFNFEVFYRPDGSFYLEIINGAERIRVDDIRFGLDRSIGKDTIHIRLPKYDSEIKALYEEDAIEGDWFDNTRADYSIPFRAYHGRPYRFFALDVEANASVGGVWAAEFEIETGDPYPAIGRFTQEGNRVTGTFLTETGDYRYLEGTVRADRLYLSGFDGAHAFLFEAKFQEDGTLSGIFRSGRHYKTYWTARRDPGARLQNPDSLTVIRPGNGRFDFTFPNLRGDSVSLSDPVYAGKPVLVYLFGTWCPNCRDAAAFITEYLQQHPNAPVEVIGIAFERYTDREKAIQALKNYQAYHDIDYEILYGGRIERGEVARQLPMLSRFPATPTLIFVNRRGEVEKVYTGFAGPATQAYATFRRTFENTMDRISREIQ